MRYSIVDRGRHRLALTCTALIAASLAYGLTALVATAHAEGPGSGTPTVVSLGDSFISGEAGRWAGNTDESSSKTDALGSTAYYDNSTDTAELIKGCHRSKSAEVYIGGGVNGENLACSGAKTTSFTTEGLFKPGIDFYNSGGNEGQALMLQHFAADHNVKLVALSIGGNNFNFAGIVTTCVEDFLESTIFYDFYCSEESSVTKNFTSSNANKVKGEIETAIKNVATAMTNAGYTSSQYTILVQNYPSPIPNGSEFRYTQSGYSRQFTGGCGFWNKDANYANATMLPTIDNAVLGAAAESLTRLSGPFDFVFIDADKEGTPEYFQHAVELSRPGTVIVTDNVVRDGQIADSDTADPRALGMRRFHELLARGGPWSATTIQTVGNKGYDGFTLALLDGPPAGG